MGKRNVRILASEMDTRFKEIQGKNVHVVMMDGTTYSGRVLESEPGKLVLIDANAGWTSRKRHTHTLNLQLVQEIILDLVAAY